MVCIIGLLHVSLYAVTEVYNLRISTLTSERIDLDATVGANENLPSIFTTKLVTRIRKTRIGNEQLLGATMNSLIYTYKKFYARVDTGWGYVRERDADPTVATTRHTQPDDILFSIGYRHLVKPHVHLTYSTLVGVPTHKDHSFEFFQFGTGHYAVGGQIDSIVKQEPSAWITALRCVHFFKAKAPFPTATTCIPLDFSLGNLVDIIIAYYRKIHNKHSLEIGYNPTFAFSLHSCPPLSFNDLPTYGIRNAWYSIYRYSFVRGKYPMGIGLNVSYGFDIAPKLDSSIRRNMSFWISYNVKF